MVLFVVLLSEVLYLVFLSLCLRLARLSSFFQEAGGSVEFRVEDESLHGHLSREDDL